MAPSRLAGAALKLPEARFVPEWALRVPRVPVAQVSRAVQVRWCRLSAAWASCVPVCCCFRGTGEIKNKICNNN